MKRTALLSLLLAGCPSLQAQEAPAPQIRTLLQTTGLGPGVDQRQLSFGALLPFQSVQKDLGFTEEQNKRFNDLHGNYDKTLRENLETFHAKRRELQDNGALNGETLAGLNELRNAEDRKVHDRYERGLNAVLNKSQAKRLREIQLQLEGVAAFERPEVLEQLNLAPDQVEAITLIRREARRQLSAAARLPQPEEMSPERYESKAYRKTVRDVRKAAGQIREGALQQIARLLTKNQRARYLAMTGKPFDPTRIGEDIEAPFKKPDPAVK